MHLILFTEPFSCACINRYGFRYCLFIGSVLSITWLLLLIWFIDSPFNFEYCFLLAIAGGNSHEYYLYYYIFAYYWLKLDLKIINNYYYCGLTVK